MDSILSTAAPKPSLPLALDHLVVAARSLEEGEAWLKARLRRDLVVGGAHPGFGTHNRLLRLGDDCYLELIAADPAQSTPHLLFGLEQEAVARALADGPLLLHTVFRVVAPATLESVLPRLAYQPGLPTAMSRGALRWRITIPAGGRLAGDGLLPTIIDWGDARHPCARLPDSGVVLGSLRLEGPQAVVGAFPQTSGTPASSASANSADDADSADNDANRAPGEARRAGGVRPTIVAASSNKIYAEFLVDGTKVIIESRLPLRDLA